mgnify:CR=1 FL=1
MNSKIFMSNYKKDFTLQTDEEVTEMARKWIDQVGFKYNIKDIKRNNILNKLIITIYYEEKPI